MLIPIDRTTIRHNPDAGNTVKYILGNISTTKIEIKDKVRSIYILSNKEYRLICQEYNIDEKDSVNIMAEQECFPIYHLPEQEFLYKYQDIDLPCDCGWTGKRYDLVENYSDYSSEHCPKCGDAVNYTFEKLTDKELEGLANND